MTRMKDATSSSSSTSTSTSSTRRSSILENYFIHNLDHENDNDNDNENDNDNDNDRLASRSRSRSRRTLQQQQQQGYVPAFAGYLTLGFSVHDPCERDSDSDYCDGELSTSNNEQERLESLVMLFLCSQGVELVVSTDPTSILPVCPFNGIGGNINSNSNSVGVGVDNEAQNVAMTKSVDNGNGNGNVNGNGNSAMQLADEQLNQMIVWNLPKVTSQTVPFDNIDETTTTVIDMATNTTTTTTTTTTSSTTSSTITTSTPQGQGPQQYYTQLSFTYPVYQWGDYEDSNSISEELQNEFDSSVVRTGTLDSLLPWTNAIAAPIGDEPYVFWNEPLPQAPAYYDTTIPQDVGTMLQYIGGGLILFNTIVSLLLAWIARCHNNRRERLSTKRKEEHERRMSGNGHGGLMNNRRAGPASDYLDLDTEAGVSAILMESKQYALTTKSAYENLRAPGAASNSNSNNNYNNNIANNYNNKNIANNYNYTNGTSSNCNSNSNSSTDNNISGVEVGLKEKSLVARAHQQAANSYKSPSNQWFSGKKLLGSTGSTGSNDDYDDEEAENMRADLQILNLSGDDNIMIQGNRDAHHISF